MLVLKPFAEKYLEDAATLFVSNYRLLREKCPILPEEYENREVIIPLIKNLLGETKGVVALRKSMLAGYVIGFRIPYFKGTSYGAYCPEWGHSATEEMKTEIYNQMYREISRQWVANGCFTHSFSFLAHEQEMLDHFFWNGFGLLVIDAIRSLDVINQDSHPDVSIRPDVTIRGAESDDAEAIIRLEHELQRHLAGPPIFLLEDELPNPDELKRELSEKTKKIWLAFVEDEPVAYLQAELSAHGAAQIVNDSETISITGAYTLPNHRGRGIAAALLYQLLDDAADNGFKRCSVDFEAFNLEGRRFWLTHFEPVCYSVIRRIDENVSWANSRFDLF